MADPLEHRTIAELEGASRRLNAHIKERRRRSRPSLTRRIIGLSISVPMMLIGLCLGTYALLFIDKHLLKFLAVSGALFVMALIWIYADWFDPTD